MSSEQIIEVVPNFSTANTSVVEQISSAIKTVNGVKLLNVEPDADYNRTVITFVGNADNVVNAAFNAIAKAAELIDMEKHKGEHPRMGATDVCPFIPVMNATVEECVELAKNLANKVAQELNIPTYLYGKAANSSQRVKLSDIRKGEYEGFEEKILQPEWKPDYGKPIFNKRSGATTIGVRGFLIAYNVNIESSDVSIAKEIGGLVRESGRWVEKDGERIREPGMLKGIQGMGVTLEKEGRKLTQVSMNVVDFQSMSKPHDAFEAVKKLAEENGTRVTGSELVGLIPLSAIIESGKYYAPEETDERKLVHIAIDQLGLGDLEPFLPGKKIIEYVIRNPALDQLTVNEFNHELASDKPAPGGGSVAALGGTLAAALTTMVANLTVGKDKYKESENEMQFVIKKAGVINQELLELINEDTLAFNEVMASFRVSKNDAGRAAGIQRAMKYAAEVPLKVASLSFDLLSLTKTVATKGNSNAITDAGVAALFIQAAVRGALFNTKINLTSIKDEAIKSNLNSKVKAIETELETKVNDIIKFVETQLN